MSPKTTATKEETTMRVVLLVLLSVLLLFFFVEVAEGKLQYGPNDRASERRAKEVVKVS